jgi:hypothetical protein
MSTNFEKWATCLNFFKGLKDSFTEEEYVTILAAIEADEHWAINIIWLNGDEPSEVVSQLLDILQQPIEYRQSRRQAPLPRYTKDFPVQDPNVSRLKIFGCWPNLTTLFLQLKRHKGGSKVADLALWAIQNRETLKQAAIKLVTFYPHKGENPDPKIEFAANTRSAITKLVSDAINENGARVVQKTVGDASVLVFERENGHFVFRVKEGYWIYFDHATANEDEPEKNLVAIDLNLQVIDNNPGSFTLRDSKKK